MSSRPLSSPYVEMRAVVEALGGNVDFDLITSEATFLINNQTTNAPTIIVVNVNTGGVTVNGVADTTLVTENIEGRLPLGYLTVRLPFGFS